MSDFEKILKSMKVAFDKLPNKRTKGCPTDEELYLLCCEREDEPLSRKYMTHVLTCRYCGNFIRHVLQAALDSPDTSKIRKKLFPLPEEIDFGNVKSISLFKDNSKVSHVDMSEVVGETEFDIKSSGFYHAEIDTGQVIWMHRIGNKDISLTEKEQKEMMKHGVMASTEDTGHGITSIKETRWNNQLEITLTKRISKGRLSFRIKTL